MDSLQTREHPAGTSMLNVARKGEMETNFRAAVEWTDRSLGAVFVAWEHAASADLSTTHLELLADRLSRVRRVLADVGVDGPSLEELADDVNKEIVAFLSELPPHHGPRR
jgi:hypothetical protein